MVFSRKIEGLALNEDLLKQLSEHKHALDEAAIVAITDPRGVITYINEKFCSISQYSREELIGKTHAVVNSGHHSKAFFAELWSTIVKGQTWSGEVCNKKKNGDLYWVYTTIVPFLSPMGQVEQYLAIRHEITELKLAQQIIIQQQEQLVGASRLSAIGEMAATITHEINNPLAVILGRVEMLKSMLKDGSYTLHDLQRVADTIEVTGHRIEKIVRAMKTMAYHSGGSAPEELEAPSSKPVIELISDAVELCQHRFRDHGIKLEVSQFDKSLNVLCRSYQIVQVLVNLLNNSHDALFSQGSEKPGQPKSMKWVRIEVLPRQNVVEIAITDSGYGISFDVQRKMFDPFFSTKPVQYGTGLGLSVSLSLMRKAGGNLEYDHQSPNTRFVCSIPKA
jgi:PAS domain S-box-containing protein